MSKEREALKLALEALQELVAQNETSLFAMQVNAHSMINARGVMKVIREALAEQPAQKRPQNCGTGYCSCIECVMEQPSQQQEPDYKALWQQMCERCDELDAKLAQQQEPVAWTSWRELAGARHYGTTGWVMRAHKLSDEDIPLYTFPQSKPWVWLTDEEVKPLCDENHIIFGAYTVDFIQAIEAKLREKNAQQSKPLTDDQIKLIMDGRGEEGDGDYVKPAFDPFGISEDDLMNFARAIEAAHGIKGKA